jgi:3',5'-cyclic-AMP phosphodiesterase
MRSLFILSILSLLLLVSCTVKENGFRFVFMTDIHIQPERRGDAGFAAAIDKVNQLSPDFVITGGDLIMDALNQKYSRADSLYSLYNTVSKNFGMPVYNTLGNHEVFGLYESSGISQQHAEYGKKMFIDRMGYENTYTSFDHKGWHFIILDGIGFTPERKYYGVIDDEQLAWIKEDLTKIDATTPIVLSTHIPFVSVFGQMQNDPLSAGSASTRITNGKEVLEVFSDHNLKLVLQGHLHEVEEIKYRGTTYITGGAVCGGWWKGDRDGFAEGFAVIDVVGDDFEWSYKSYGWKAEKSQDNE